MSTTAAHHPHHDQKDISSFGFWLYIMSDCLLFATLFATFAVLRNNTAMGPAAGDIFSIPFVFLETMILLCSSFTCGLALLSMRSGHGSRVIGWLFVTAILGASFVALEIHEFAQLAIEGHSWQASAFLSSFFTLVGTHGLHVTIGLIWMSVLWIHMLVKGVTEKSDRQLVCLALFWHFLDVIWIFIFSFVYLIPLVL